MSGIRSRVIVADIGGTNARFALIDGGELGPIESIAVADYVDFGAALEAFLHSHRERDHISGAILAAAGPVEEGNCVLTNSNWVINAAQLCSAFGFPQVRIINDFEAVAWSIPKLTATDLFNIGGGKAVPHAPAIVLGPGTGFGLACLVLQSHGAMVIGTEAGHATLPATCREEDGIIEWLRERFGHVSVERGLSGGGLGNLYDALAAINGLSIPARNAAEIVEAALAGSCPTARAALDMFCALLGTVAGDAVLTFGARGGVYIAGGIVPRIPEYLARSQFRTRFEAKGRFRDYVAGVPASVIIHPDPAFLGLQFLAKQEFGP
ncbi:MAG: glucokinase [Methylovirgula sp.]